MFTDSYLFMYCSLFILNFYIQLSKISHKYHKNWDLNIFLRSYWQYLIIFTFKFVFTHFKAGILKLFYNSLFLRFSFTSCGNKFIFFLLPECNIILFSCKICNCSLLLFSEEEQSIELSLYFFIFFNWLFYLIFYILFISQK